MPNKKALTDPAMLRLPEALRRRMQALGHTQSDVHAVTGVSQPQISKALNAHRKRLTEPMRALCHYADLEVAQEQPPALAELAQLLQTLVDGNPAAADCVKGVLKSLAPLVAGAHLGQSH
jgi:transcriptional regulator with XRE-family HTH domain